MTTFLQSRHLPTNINANMNTNVDSTILKQSPAIVNNTTDCIDAW